MTALVEKVWAQNCAPEFVFRSTVYNGRCMVFEKGIYLGKDRTQHSKLAFRAIHNEQCSTNLALLVKTRKRLLLGHKNGPNFRISDHTKHLFV